MVNNQFQQRQPEQVRISLGWVLYVKFLRWVENSSASSLMKATINCLTFLVITLAIMTPNFCLGMLTAALHWHLSARVAILFVTLSLVLNAKRLLRLVKNVYALKDRKGNQHTYEGIPLDTFATYLCEHGTFTTKAISDLGLSQRKWARIAEQLEHNKILIRGENNSRVLGEIDRPTLVQQLRDNFPLVFDPVGKTWVARRGSFDQWVLQKERKEEKEEEQRERLERKEQRLRASIEEMKTQQSPFSIMSVTQ